MGLKTKTMNRANAILIIFLIINISVQAQLRDEYRDWNKNYHIVTGSSVNVRSSPNVNSEVVARLNIGDKVIISSLSDNSYEINGIIRPFYQIYFTEKNETKDGYIWSGLTSQYYLYENGSTYFLKEEHLIKDSPRTLVSINKLEKSQITRIGSFEHYKSRYIKLNALPITEIDGIKNALKVRVQLSGEICESQHFEFLLLETNNNNWIEVPRIFSYDAIEANSIEKFILPTEPFGEADKIIIAHQYSNLDRSEFKLEKIKYYTWENNELIETPYNTK